VVTLTRVDDPQLAVRGVEAAYRRIRDGIGCAHCGAAALQREFSLMLARPGTCEVECDCHDAVRALAEEVTSRLGAIAAHLRETDKCRACSRARRAVRARWKPGDTGPCPSHARCSTHAARAES
jgi:hypothetical protein